MPQNFETTIQPKEIEQLVQYLIESTARRQGQGGGSKRQGRLSRSGGRERPLASSADAMRMRDRLQITPQLYAQGRRWSPSARSR